MPEADMETGPDARVRKQRLLIEQLEQSGRDATRAKELLQIILSVRQEIATAKELLCRLSQASECEYMIKLTCREREVLSLIAKGKRSKQIAAELGIAERTVAGHRSRLVLKTGSKGMGEVIAMASRIRAI